MYSTLSDSIVNQDYFDYNKFETIKKFDVYYPRFYPIYL